MEGIKKGFQVDGCLTTMDNEIESQCQSDLRWWVVMINIIILIISPSRMIDNVSHSVDFGRSLIVRCLSLWRILSRSNNNSGQ